MAINNSLIGLTSTDLYVSTENTAVTVMYLCNISNSPVTVQLHVVPDGEGVIDQNKIYHDLTIPATDTFIIDTERLLLVAGDRLVGAASSVDAVACTVSTLGI